MVVARFVRVAPASLMPSPASIALIRITGSAMWTVSQGIFSPAQERTPNIMHRPERDEGAEPPAIDRTGFVGASRSMSPLPGRAARSGRG